MIEKNRNRLVDQRISLSDEHDLRPSQASNYDLPRKRYETENTQTTHKKRIYRGLDLMCIPKKLSPKISVAVVNVPSNFTKSVLFCMNPDTF